MNITKIIGWLVFFLGISIIVFTIYSTYNIFIGKSAAPQIISFNVKEMQEDISRNSSEIEQIISQQLSSILPLDSLPLILNLVVWTIGAGILIFGGAQIAGLGIKLIKND
jgi:hypothetical protein